MTKQIRLVVFSLAALVSARPAGFYTANTQAEDIATMQARLDEQEKELAALRAAQAVPVQPPAGLPSATALLIKGAGVEEAAVLWRIRAGLSPAQAVEVALTEKREAAARKEKK